MAQAYRGYLIRRGFDGMFYVSKGGAHICAAASLQAAQRAIDEIVG